MMSPSRHFQTKKSLHVCCHNSVPWQSQIWTMYLNIYYNKVHSWRSNYDVPVKVSVYVCILRIINSDVLWGNNQTNKSKVRYFILWESIAQELHIWPAATVIFQGHMVKHSNIPCIHCEGTWPVEQMIEWSRLGGCSKNKQVVVYCQVWVLGPKISAHGRVIVESQVINNSIKPLQKWSIVVSMSWSSKIDKKCIYWPHKIHP